MPDLPRPPARVPARPPARLAVTAGGVLGALVVGTGVTLLVTAGTSGPSYEIRRELAPLDLVMSTVNGGLGTLMARRRRHPAGWVFLAIGLGYAVTAAGIAWTVLGVAHPALPGLAWSPSVLLTGWTTSTLLTVLVVPWLVAPRSPTGGSRAGVLACAAVVLVATALRLMVRVDGAAPHPVTGDGGAARAVERLDHALIPLYFVLALVVVALLALRLQRAGPHVRRAFHWLLGPLVAIAVAYLSFEIGVSLDGRWYVAGTAAIFVAELTLPVVVFLLLQRQPSWRVDLAVSRALVGGLLSAILVAAYVVAVWTLSTIAPWGEASSGVVAVAGLALAVLPVRDWLQRRVERLVFGSGADPSELLERVARALQSTDGDSPQLTELVAALQRALRLGRVEVALRGRRVAVAGRDEGGADRGVPIDLVSDGGTIGTLTAVPRRGERLDPRSQRLLRQISGLVAVAAQLDETNRALEEARARVVEVRHEERRLLRRELHDGLGPALSGTALALAAVPSTSALSPDDTALLQRLVEELSHRADDVRQMARVLLPPVLDEGRLGAALGILADRSSTPRFAVTVDAPHADRLDGIHQIVVYQVAAEAVRNAQRHGGGRRCAIRLDLPPAGGVRLEVRDDGRGIDPASGPGVGMASMRERAAELGGTVSVISDEEGTIVSMILP